MSSEDHDLLIRVSQQMDTVMKLLTNHLEHHFWYNVTLAGGFLATVTSVALYFLQARH